MESRLQKIKTYTDSPSLRGVLQRRCAGGKLSSSGESEGCKKRLNRQNRDTAVSGPVTAPPIVDEVVRGPAQPLDGATRRFMESRFGRDFSSVRIHAGARAAASAWAVGARAYTVGRNIVFGSGEYRPQVVSGRRLVAHELAHVVQQSRSSDAIAGNGLQIAPAGTPLEHEADRMAAQVTSESSMPASGPLAASSVSLHSLARAVVQREEGGAREPLIPIPVFDELDPVIIVPDVPGVPSFLRGRSVPLSTLRSALDVLRGNPPSMGGEEEDFCARLVPGYETAPSGRVQGKCCPRFVREPSRCCRWQDLAMLDFRCCGRDEVVISGHCVRPRRAPIPTPGRPRPTGSTPGGLTVPEIPRLEMPSSPIPMGTIQEDTIDHFVLGHAEIPSTAAATATLNLLARQLRLYRDAEVHVAGHTDSSAGEALNQRLSERRANAVRDALVRRGISGSRISVQGFGETRLLFPAEANAEERARNRRVDVWFYIPPSHGLGEGLRLRIPSLGGEEEGTP